MFCSDHGIYCGYGRRIPTGTRRVARRGYGTISEYVRELIRKDQERTQLRNLLLDGAASAPSGVADAAYFEGLRDHIRRHAAK